MLLKHYDATSRGPVGSLPGSRHVVPDDAACHGYNVDHVPNVKATHRVQGETDSFGCEYTDYCAECFDKMRAAQEARKQEPSHCDWCKSEKVGCRPHRDFEEGMAGAVYNVCPECRAKESEELWAESRKEAIIDLDLDDYDYNDQPLPFEEEPQ